MYIYVKVWKFFHLLFCWCTSNIIFKSRIDPTEVADLNRRFNLSGNSKEETVENWSKSFVQSARWKNQSSFSALK